MTETSYKLGNCQILLATISCPKDADLEYWRTLAFNISKAIGLTPLEWNSAGYPGGGLTLTWFLSESHIAIDTYIEEELAEVTLVSCKKFDITPVTKLLNDNGLIIHSITQLLKRADHRWRAF